MKTGTALVQLLQAYGVELVFGIPGTHSIELYRGLAECRLRHVLPRHEQGAGFMADGYARLSGKPGVCFVITGPGVSNIATAMAQAKSDSVPMLVISPVNDPSPEPGYNLGRLHELDDQAAVTRPCCVLSETVQTLEQIPRLIADAFTIFSSERPGPVHLNIPLSLLRAEVESAWQPAQLKAPPQIDSTELQSLLEACSAARSPVLIAGGGCRQFPELVVALAEKLAWPVATTVAGRGVIADSHPLCLGAQTGAAAVQQFIAESDLLLVLGSELAEPDHWNENLQLPERQIWINLDTRLLRRHAGQMTLHADLQLLIPQWLRLLAEPSAEQQQQARLRCQSPRDTARAHFSPVQQQHWRVLTELKKTLPANTRIFSDMTQIAYTAADYMPWPEANCWMHPNGYGTLGYALPAAIGACFSDSTDPILVIVGDAGFQYTIAELGVAAEHQLKIVLLLWQNHALQQIADDMQQAGFTPFAIRQTNPDFLELARAYGWSGKKLAGVFELGSAIEAAFAGTGPVLLELEQTQV